MTLGDCSYSLSKSGPACGPKEVDASLLLNKFSDGASSSSHSYSHDIAQLLS